MPSPKAASASALAAAYALSRSSATWTSAHALASSAGRGLDQHREPGLERRAADLVEVGGAVRPRDERNPGGAHLLLRAHLVAHPLHHVGGRPDEDEVVVLARAHEGRVLGEEAVARMHRLAPGVHGRGDDVRDPEVALHGGGRADAHGLVGELDVERVASAVE